MKKTFRLIFVVILGSVVLASDYDAYQIVNDRNIFSKNITQTEEVIPPIEQPQQQEELYVLRGIAWNGPERIIFIENQITGEYLRAAAGAVFHSGVVKGIFMNKFTYEENGILRSINIGDTICRTIIKQPVNQEHEMVQTVN